MNASPAPSSPQSDLGSGFNYQGYLTGNGGPANGTFDFYFELFDAEISGTSIMTDTIEDVTVDDGLFTVLLDFGGNAFNGMPRWLEISVRPGSETGAYTPFAGRQHITPVPYALYAVEADLLDGFHASELSTHYQNAVVVAKSGGDFTSIQAAIDSITDAHDSNPYLVWVAPGTYEEQVKLKPGINLVGAGKSLTFIESTIGNADIYPPAEATLHLADYANVRSLTVSNYSDQYRNAAILIPENSEHATLKDVSAVTGGTGMHDSSIFIHGANTNVTLDNVESSAYGGSQVNIGIEVVQGATVTFKGGVYGGYNGVWAIGILAADSETMLNLYGVRGEGADSDSYASALNVIDNAFVSVQGGSFEARNAFTETIGISVWNGGELEAKSVIVQGHDSPLYNKGLSVSNGSWATINEGTFTAWGGTESNGVIVTGGDNGGSWMKATSIDATGKGASYQNDGLHVEGGSWSSVTGGFLRGYNGDLARGVVLVDQDTYVELTGVSSEGADCNAYAIGLNIIQNAIGKVVGGSYEGRNGISGTIAINLDGGSYIEAANVFGIGEVDYDNSEFNDSNNYGLVVTNGSTAEVNGGMFKGRCGSEAFGMFTNGGGRIKATDVTAVGEESPVSNDGLRVEGGATAMITGGLLLGQGGADNRGAASFHTDSILDLNNLAIYGDAGDTSIGVSNEFGSIASITGSEIYGITYTVLAEGTSTAIHLTRLVGGLIMGSGDIICTAVTYGNPGVFYANACP